MKISRILALTDLSGNSVAGLRLAECLGRRWKARVVVGYAHTRSDILSGFGRSSGELQRLADWVHAEHEEQLTTLAHEHVNELRLDGVESVDTDSAREGVQRMLERVKPDLVCMSTHGRSGVKHLLLGSVAEHTLRTAGVPVAVTKGAAMPGPAEPLRVLLGLDLLDDPAALAKRVAEHLGPKDELLLGHMVESWYYSPAAYGSEFALPQPDVPRLIESAKTRMEAIDLGEGGPRISVHVDAARPGEGLLALEEELQPHIVALRTHGRRGFDRMMLGSVSEFLARRCTGTVLVFPKDA